MSHIGVGAVYWPALHTLFKDAPNLLTVLEVEPQTLWQFNAASGARYLLNQAAFDAIAQLPQRKVIHGVGFPVGGTVSPDPEHIPPFIASVNALGAEWASEHLSFNEIAVGNGSLQCGFLLPPCQNLEGVEIAAANIRHVQSQLAVPFAFETGVSYLKPHPFEMSDGSFFRAVAERANCGIVLDLHNLWANELNGRRSLRDVLTELPLERILEIHLAGGMEMDGYYLDAHSGAVPEALLAFAADLVPRLTNLRAVVFEILPYYIPRLGIDGVIKQIEQLQTLVRSTKEGGYGRPPSFPEQRAVANTNPTVSAGAPLRSVDTHMSPQQWEAIIGGLVVGGTAAPSSDRGLGADPGIAIVKSLARDFRRGGLVDALRLSCTLILLTKGVVMFQFLMDGFADCSPAERFSIVDADRFALYLVDKGLRIPYLDEVLAYEHAILRASLYGEYSTVTFKHDPSVLLGGLLDGILDTPIPEGDYTIGLSGYVAPLSVR
jgi:uncharacterized protein (UPF0276 family)